MKFGRNEPCHCGSGKKYKRCCLTKDQVEDQTVHLIDNELQKLRRTEREMVELLLHVAHDWYGPDFINQAWEEYTSSSSEALSIEEAPEAGTSFIPWALFDYIPREPDPDAEPNEVPVAFSFLIVADD